MSALHLPVQPWWSRPGWSRTARQTRRVRCLHPPPSCAPQAASQAVGRELSRQSCAESQAKTEWLSAVSLCLRILPEFDRDLQDQVQGKAARERSFALRTQDFACGLPLGWRLAHARKSAQVAKTGQMRHA